MKGTLRCVTVVSRVLCGQTTSPDPSQGRTRVRLWHSLAPHTPSGHPPRCGTRGHEARRRHRRGGYRKGPSPRTPGRQQGPRAAAHVLELQPDLPTPPGPGVPPSAPEPHLPVTLLNSSGRHRALWLALLILTTLHFPTLRTDGSIPMSPARQHCESPGVHTPRCTRDQRPESRRQPPLILVTTTQSHSGRRSWGSARTCSSGGESRPRPAPAPVHLLPGLPAGPSAPPPRADTDEAAPSALAQVDRKRGWHSCEEKTHSFPRC